MAEDNTTSVDSPSGTAAPALKRDGSDPVAPDDPMPDTPATERGALAELGGTTRYQGYAVAGDIRSANKLKNAGLRGAMPPWTLVDFGTDGVVQFRIIHFDVGMIRSIQRRETEEVRKALSWQKLKPLPAWGGIEVNARTMMSAIVECTAGSKVDMEGARKANVIRNDGLVYAFPSTLFQGLKLRLLHLGHPWLHVVRSDAEAFLREAMGIAAKSELPAEAETEIERYMVIASIVGCESGTIRCARPNGDLYDVDLAELAKGGIDKLRRWWVTEMLPAPDLSGKVPPGRSEQIEHFKFMFKDHNPDVMRAFRDGHTAIRTAENEELLVWGDEFVAGANWDRMDRDMPSYEPEESGLVDLVSMDKKELEIELRNSLFPKIDLKTRPPAGGSGREEYFRRIYGPFNNGALNELLELEDQIREVDYSVLLGKGADFVGGLSESSGFID